MGPIERHPKFRAWRESKGAEQRRINDTIYIFSFCSHRWRPTAFLLIAEVIPRLAAGGHPTTVSLVRVSGPPTRSALTRKGLFRYVFWLILTDCAPSSWIFCIWEEAGELKCIFIEIRWDLWFRFVLDITARHFLSLPLKFELRILHADGRFLHSYVPGSSFILNRAFFLIPVCSCYSKR